MDKETNMKIYSGIFFDNGLHMTWDYRPNECVLPKGVKEGEKATVDVYGAYLSSGSGVLAVNFDLLTHQLNTNTPLHISLYWRTAPVVCGTVIKAATLNKELTPVSFTMTGKWGYHDRDMRI